MKVDIVWPKKITVDRKIVQTLSGATYDSFPKSIKELIINSYDALATEVTIKINLKEEILTIEDNGVGMTSTDFDFYVRIAGSTRNKESSAYDYYARPKVGKFGIGFLSTFPFFQNFYIESKKRDTSEYLYANIPCSKYFDKDNQLADVSDIPISGGVRVNTKLKDRQYTKIVLSGFTKLSRAFFNEEYNIKGRRDTILKYDAIKRLRWELTEDLPVPHERSELDEILRFSTEQLPFHVYLQEDELFRKSYGDVLLDHSTTIEEIGNIKFRYFISTNYSPISPVESRYLKVRNLNVGVGGRDTFGIGLEGRLYAKLAWLTGEINVIEGLNDLIAASRDKFNYSPDFENFKEFFREKLRQWSINLEAVNELQKEVLSIQQDESIKTLKDLSKNNIDKQIDALTRKGFVITNSSSESDKPVKLDRVNKEITIYTPVGNIEKKLRVGNNVYVLQEEQWDYLNERLPACRIVNDRLIINSAYPLFNNAKLFDPILKMQVIILKNNQLGNIDDDSFSSIQADILDAFL